MTHKNNLSKLLIVPFGTAFLCILLLLMAKQAKALPDPEMQTGQKIDNSGLGFSYYLPEGWTELDPMLLAIYNTTVNTLSKSAEPPYLVAAYANRGSQFIPPIVMMHYIEQPMSSAQVGAYNNMFLEEARDTEGKSKVAQKLGLASEVRFIKEASLRPGTPLVVAEADSNFGFTVKVMASPFYFRHGMLIVSYFAPKDDFTRFENDMLVFFRGITINQDQLPD